MTQQRKYKRNEIIDENKETQLLSTLIELALEQKNKGWKVDGNNSSIQYKPHPITKRPIKRGIVKNKCNTTIQQIYDYYKGGYKEEYSDIMYHIDDDHDIVHEHENSNSSLISDRDYQYMSTRFKMMNYKSLDGIEYNIIGWFLYNISETHPLYQSPSKKYIRGKQESGIIYYQRVNAEDNDFMCVFIYFTLHYGGWVPNWQETSAQSNAIKTRMDTFDKWCKIDIPNRLQMRKNKRYKEMESILIKCNNKSKEECINIYKQLISLGFEENISIKVSKLYPNNLNKAIQTLNNKQNKIERKQNDNNNNNILNKSQNDSTINNNCSECGYPITEKDFQSNFTIDTIYGLKHLKCPLNIQNTHNNYSSNLKDKIKKKKDNTKYENKNNDFDMNNNNNNNNINDNDDIIHHTHITDTNKGNNILNKSQNNSTPKGNEMKEDKKLQFEEKKENENNLKQRIKLEKEREEMEQKFNALKLKFEKEKQEKEHKIDNQNEQNNNINEVNLEHLLKEWNLSQYIQILVIKEGYEEIIDCIDLSLNELKAMGFKSGHAKKFKRKVNEYIEQNAKPIENNNIQYQNDECVEGQDGTNYI